MQVERHTVQACCKRVTTILKTDRPIMPSDIQALVNLGFTEAEHFTKAGILYVDNLDLIITGPIGSDRLQVKCKIQDCTQKVNDFEVLLQQLG